MKVKEVMTSNPGFCHPESNLAELAALMWENACGVIPIVNRSGVVTGMITDRDICIALGTRNVRASEIKAADVAPPRYFACGPEDDVRDALSTMANQEVRRLPVTDKEGKLAGILSIDDLILCAGNGSGLTFKDVVTALKAIRGVRTHEPIVVRPTTAVAASTV